MSRKRDVLDHGLLATILLVLISACLGDPGSDAPNVAVSTSDPVCHGTLNGIDLRLASIAELQAALAAGTFTSAELVDAYVARIQAFDRAGPILNSVRSINTNARDEAALLDAERGAGNIRGPLHGIPILFKDVIGTMDAPTTAGSIALELNTPPEDSTIVARLREAGAIILGKTNLNEFSNWMGMGMPMGYSSLGGQVINAYTGGSPGGSSAGSGVAGSMAFSTVTIGTDTTGSVTYPSQMSSLAGLRPTHALVSHAGIIPIIPHFDAPGPMGRTVTDVALTLGPMVGPDPLDPFTASSAGQFPKDRDYASTLSTDALRGVRLGYDMDNANRSFADVRGQLSDLGAILVPIRIDPDALSQSGTAQIAGLAFNEFKFSINHYLANTAGPGLPVKTLADIIEYNSRHPDKVKYGQEFLELSEATPGRRELTDPSAAAVVADSRAVADAHFLRDDLDAIIGVSEDFTPYSPFTAAAGYPNMVVPAGYNGRVPQGLSFFGPQWSDQDLLSYAYAYEQATLLRQPPELVNPDMLRRVCPDLWRGDGF